VETAGGSTVEPRVALPLLLPAPAAAHRVTPLLLLRRLLQLNRTKPSLLHMRQQPAAAAAGGVTLCTGSGTLEARVALPLLLLAPPCFIKVPGAYCVEYGRQLCMRYATAACAHHRPMFFAALQQTQLISSGLRRCKTAARSISGTN
jgi:hypothetical protein